MIGDPWFAPSPEKRDYRNVARQAADEILAQDAAVLTTT
jgi:hypothetical protein